MPADFLSHIYIDEVATNLNSKTTTVAINPFTLTLLEEQAADPDMTKFKQFFVKKSWPLGTSKLDKNCLLPLMIFFTHNGLVWIRLDDFERQCVALNLPHKF